MRTYSKVEETHTTTRMVLEGVLCDWCGKEVERLGYGLDSYDEFVFGFYCQEGKSYPEGGSMVEWEVEDLCKACIRKLRKMLEEAGITIKESRKEW